MKQEEKQLLFQDLCARLPYGVKCRQHKLDSQVCTLCPEYLKDFDAVEEFEPYLRPMESMTKKEKKELLDLCDMYDPYHDTDPYDDWGIQMFTQHVHSDTVKFIAKNLGAVMNWLNAHHFDYNGLIPMGIALEAKEGMYDV